MTDIGSALSKGRILEETGPLLARVGLRYDFSEGVVASWKNCAIHNIGPL